MGKHSLHQGPLCRGKSLFILTSMSSFKDGVTMCGVGLPEIVLNPPPTTPFILLDGLVLICGLTAD